MRKRERQMGRMPCGDRDWSDKFISQGMPRLDSNHQKTGRGKEGSFP